MTINIYADAPLTQIDVVTSKKESQPGYTGLRLSRTGTETKKRGPVAVNAGDSITFWTKDDATPEENSSVYALMRVLETALATLNNHSAAKPPTPEPTT